MEVYTKENPYFETFGTDILKNLKHIKNQKVYEDLIEAAVSVTEKFAWNKDQKAIVAFVVKDNRIKNPNKKLQKVIQSHQLSTGKKAPDLIAMQSLVAINKTFALKTAALSSKYSLLLFYQSGCGHCDTAIAWLKSQYEELTVKGIKIISIAGDTDQDTFAKSASAFPWSDKYRDVEGMNGINFKNYAIMGTPTMFLLDSKGIIIEKIATIEQLLARMEQKR
jgi:thiol-disulfide isomerase/thioredoxin